MFFRYFIKGNNFWFASPDYEIFLKGVCSETKDFAPLGIKPYEERGRNENGSIASPLNVSV